MTAAPPSRSLADLVSALGPVRAAISGEPSTRIRDVRHDSRAVEVGDLFVARVGATTSGIAFVEDAVRRGAAAIMVERGTPLGAQTVPVVEVADLKLGMALAAEEIHGNPSRALGVVGVTGTNGKTTVAWLVEHALSAAGFCTGRLGTLGFSLGNEQAESPLTTPEADAVSRYLARARDRGAKYFVLEASSHALLQARVDALRFAVAVFTNLTQDHLDYHATMPAYAEAKARLFVDLAPGAAVVNDDDPFGRELVRRLAGGTARLVRVGHQTRADVWLRDLTTGPGGVRITVSVRGHDMDIVSPLVGRHNVDNLLSVLGIAVALDLPVEAIGAALANTQAAPGRLERCDAPEDDIQVLVDYAHTPDALERALAAVRDLTQGDLICVFGCGGDRDPDKRPMMGDAVGRAATRAIISNDNPRTEDPVRIAGMIEPAIRASGTPYEVVLDRRQAIERAIAMARPGDVVLIAGKGHEDYQIIGKTKRPFDDRVEARRALRQRRTAREFERVGSEELAATGKGR